MSGPLLYAMYSRLKLLSGSFGGLGGSFLSGSGFLGRSLSGSLGGFSLSLLGVLSSTLSLLGSLGFALGLLSSLELGSLRSLSGLLLGLSLGDHVGSRAELVGKALDASAGVDELPVKNGWHLLQMSIFSSLLVERVVKTLPQVHLTVHSTYSG